MGVVGGKVARLFWGGKGEERGLFTMGEVGIKFRDEGDWNNEVFGANIILGDIMEWGWWEGWYGVIGLEKARGPKCEATKKNVSKEC
jgi:hypothetical protein